MYVAFTLLGALFWGKVEFVEAIPQVFRIPPVLIARVGGRSHYTHDARSCIYRLLPGSFGCLTSPSSETSVTLSYAATQERRPALPCRAD